MNANRYSIYFDNMAVKAAKKEITGRDVLADIASKIETYPELLSIIGQSSWIDYAGKMYSLQDESCDEHLHIFLLRALIITSGATLPQMPITPEELKTLSDQMRSELLTGQ